MSTRRTPLCDERVLVALEAAREAGAIQREHLETASRHEYKSPGELVTQTDVRAEREILDRITTRYPDHSILAEESGVADGSTNHRWLVDPLDGTVNFYHGVPDFAVSIALETAGTVEVAVVYYVTRDTVFTAVRGEGAYRETARLEVSSERSLDRSLVATGFDSGRPESFEALASVVREAHGVRRIGSAAIDLAYVAAGLFEGFYQWGVKPWDVAAGRLLVEEAGGDVTDYADVPETGTPDATAILATNGHVHGELWHRVRP
jgi:myo-inositol-1(or 4)-monophosphatase